jgi:hypothetical protein
MSPHDLRPSAQLMNLITGKMVTHAISSAVELGLIDTLADATKRADEVADATGVSRDGTYRLLRALSVVGVVTELQDRTFRLTPTGTLLRTDVPGSLAGAARLMGASLSSMLADGTVRARAHHRARHSTPSAFLRSARSSISRCS